MNKKDQANKIKTIQLQDELLQQIKQVWRVGRDRSDQARRLVDGNINLDTDKDAIQALAAFVNLQLVLNEYELREIKNEH